MEIIKTLSKDQNGLREHEDYLEPKFLWVIISTANFLTNSTIYSISK